MSKLLSISIVLLAASTSAFAQTYTVLHNFGTAAGQPFDPDGMIAQSRGGAMLTTSLNDYGTNEHGTVFRIWPSGSLTVLHQFPQHTQSDSGVVLATDGDYYGTTYDGGANGLGSVFKMAPNGSVTTLHSFTGGPDGQSPGENCPPIQSVQGDFYGATSGGGKQYGTLYRITKDGNFTVLHRFSGSDGNTPEGPLIQGKDLNFYGTTFVGGQFHDGVVFRISPSGNFKVMASFDGANGKNPSAGLIQASDGNFYGVTFRGGASDLGVLFRMTPGGTLTVLHSFSGGSDGQNPQAGIVQASDGNLYGTTTYGGANNYGVLFRASLSGNVVPLHTFDSATGGEPFAALFQHTNGKLYGDTHVGGTSGNGVFFSEDAGLRPFVTYLPVYGQPGAMVEILGQGFTHSSKVYFNGTQATNVTAPSATYLQATVPQGATTGPITVTTSNGTLKSNKTFIVH
jgi:uncharacterized repeat protein (TIGR03803 family)